MDCRLNSLKIIEMAPRLVESAENFIEKANSDYIEKAYYVFWDNLEHATNKCIAFEQQLRNLNSYAQEYASLVQNFNGKCPSFPATSALAPEFSSNLVTVERIESLARAAHKDFEFSSIYATRRVNNTLVAGFSNLSDALETVHNKITEVGNDLSTSIRSLALTNQEAIRSLKASISTDIDQINSSISEQTDKQERRGSQIEKLDLESAEREREALRMINNIQRQRKPLRAVTKDYFP